MAGKQDIRRLSIRHFRANMAKELNNLPIILTRDGKTVAKIDVYTKDECVHKNNDNVYTPVFRPYSKQAQLGKK